MLTHVHAVQAKRGNILVWPRLFTLIERLIANSTLFGQFCCWGLQHLEQLQEQFLGLVDVRANVYNIAFRVFDQSQSDGGPLKGILWDQSIVITGLPDT